MSAFVLHRAFFRLLKKPIMKCLSWHRSVEFAVRRAVI
jgi:hypothetical protein